MEILFFAAVAVFILFKLREQLGKIDQDQKRDSIKQFLNEQTKINNQDPTKPDVTNNVVVVSNIAQFKLIDEKSQKILDGLDNTLKSNVEAVLNKAGLSVDMFLNGAKNAFEIIISAFSIGDLQTLQPLLSEKIFLQFQAAISDRNTKGEILNTKIISIDEANITSAGLENSFGYITIMFKTKQINYIENNKTEVILGSKNDINTIIDSWTFKKDCDSKNPNWLLSSTS